MVRGESADRREEEKAIGKTDNWQVVNGLNYAIAIAS